MDGLEIRFWLMVLGHMLSDYTLQGWLADGKQESWWRKLVPDLWRSKYRYDYIAALVCHAVYWAIIVCLPLFDSQFCGGFIAVNATVHAIIDHEKANRHSISLVVDQLFHMWQIVATFAAYTLLK